MGENTQLNSGESAVVTVFGQWMIASALMASQHRPAKAREKGSNVDYAFPIVSKKDNACN